MSNLYAMRRGNGDWFSFEDDGQLLVPIFHSSHDAFMARLRTVEMLLFSPIPLDAGLLSEISHDENSVRFCIISNPFGSLRRGLPLPHAQVLSLITSEAPPQRWKWLVRPWSHD